LFDTREYETDLMGRKITFQFGKLAQLANGSVLIRYGDTAVLVTAAAESEPREGIDFFPLRVDYEERQYAAGRIPGSFFRREGRPSERAILSARLIDRPIRPLFPDGFRNDVQVVATVLSYDDDNPPEICGILGASLALSTSDIPFDGPIGAVRVGFVDGSVVVNPTAEQMENSALDLVVAGTRDGIIMVEAGAHELPETVVLEAIFQAHEVIKQVIAFQEEIVRDIGRPKMSVSLVGIPQEVEQAVFSRAADRMRRAMVAEEKMEREAQVDAVKEDILAELKGEFPEAEGAIGKALDKLEKMELRRSVVEDSIRPDGRKPHEIRAIEAEVGLLPRAHGSGLFTRGQTQVLTVAALGPVGDRQMLDNLGNQEEFKRYMHHYNFPPYSVGEVRPLRGPGRREIGHGALAERALLPVTPDEVEFPYTIRLVSEVLSSNGSTSMASVCGSSLALMDAGVPIRAAVGGVAMGLIKEKDRVVVLTDIQGVEDFLGDMDFKVAGTRKGITALQMDIKIGGVGRAVLEQALEQAKSGRFHILDRMDEAIREPRPELSPYAPRIMTLQVDPEKIRYIIGPGGKTINAIIKECGVKVDVEDDGTVFIASTDQEGGRKAREWIEQLTADVEVGRIYMGTVKRLMGFGAFVEILPNQEGLVHISGLETGRVGSVDDVVSVGDTIAVQVTEIDDSDRINLSRQAVIEQWGREKVDAVEERKGHEPGEEPKFVPAGNSKNSRGDRDGGGRNRRGDRSRQRRR